VITSSRILIGTIVAFVVMVAGFAVGLNFYESKNSSKETHFTSSTEATDNTAEANNTIYEISPPSLGLMLETYTINLSPDGSIARIEIPLSDLVKIRPGQKVFLYDKNGELKDSLGSIIGAAPYGDVAMVEIDLRDNPDVSPLDIARAKIILDRNQNAFRLPFSSLSRNEKGETFVWEVSEDIGGRNTVKYKPIEILASNDAIFTIQIDPQSSNLFILNPDANLRDGQEINVRKFLYQAPSQYEDARIASVVERRKFQIAGLKEIETVAPAIEQSSGDTSSCAQSSTAAQDFINKVRSLSEEQQRSTASP
jgi:hypothetical protein